MSLSCDCDYDCDWYYSVGSDFSILTRKRSVKCSSCKVVLRRGATVVAINRWKNGPNGNEAELGNWYFCEKCGGLYWAVEDLGFCCDIDQDISKQIHEYHEEEARWRK